MKVSVTYLVKIFDINKTISLIEESDADYIHVDFMDGKFVNNTNYEIDEIKEFLKDTKKKLDVHVMANEPLDYLDTFKELNTEYFTFHYEAVRDIKSAINKVKEANLKVGIAINPDTSIDKIKPYLNSLDLVLVMGVVPGYGGQEFISSTLDKIKELSNLKGSFKIAVDGGVNDSTAKSIKDSGADILVAGSYIVKSEDYNEIINKLKSL